MGTKVQCKSYLLVYHTMRDLNDDSSSTSWPACYGDKAMTNGQYCNGFAMRAMTDGYPRYRKDALKEKILEHEAVFRNQVCELHRLYRIQRDMMEEVRRKGLVYSLRESVEPSSSSSLQVSHVPSQDAQKWHMAGFPLLNSNYGRTPTSGVEIVNSPKSCTDTGAQPGQFPFQNGSISKHADALDSRPLKVRKKLFDLQFPADEYMETVEGEKIPEIKVSNISSYAPNGNLKCGSDSSRKSSIKGHTGLETDRWIAESASASCLRKSTRLADLNEPIEIEEAVTLPSVYKPAKSNSGYLGVNGGTVHLRNGFLTKSAESKVDEKGHLSHKYEAGSSKSNLSFTTHGLQQDKLPIPSCPMQPSLNPADHPSGPSLTGYGGKDLSREGSCHGLEYSEGNRDRFNNSHSEQLVASRAPGSYPFFGSCFNGSLGHSISSWAKSKSSFTQKIPTLESSVGSASEIDQSVQNFDQILEPFQGNWQASAFTRLQAGLGCEQATVNGLYQGPASGSKELKVQSGFDHLSCSKGNTATDSSIHHRFRISPKGPCHVDSKPVLDINLNEIALKGSSNEAVILQDLTFVDGKARPEDHLSALPWLNHKAVHADEAANTSKSGPLGNLSSSLHAASNKLSCKSETVRDLNQPYNVEIMVASSDCEMAGEKETVETQNAKKLLGFPIFEKRALKKEPASPASTSVSVDCHPEESKAIKDRIKGIIDINLECEPDEQMSEELIVEREKQTKGGASIREYIDLNSCVSDVEDPSAPSYESKTSSVKTTPEIDLEAPVPLGDDDNTTFHENTEGKVSLLSQENKNEELQEVLRNAAAAIVSISSSCPQIRIEDSIFHKSEASLADSLLWFVDTLSSFSKELESTSGNNLTVRDSSTEDSCKEMDEFEAMTLRLPEAKEEEYMPTPFVPEVQNVEETGAITLATRSRRGQSRRGRQRRDFQRDILPGLVSLSRHEVTEDLQTFVGLMRATGHHWSSGLTKRNGTRTGGARGRRRAVVEAVPAATPSSVCTPLVQQLNNIEAGLEDRSLTGWGKTTRRPRRQRYPAGNPPTVVLT